MPTPSDYDQPPLLHPIPAPRTGAPPGNKNAAKHPSRALTERITANFTIPVDSNAASVGPISVADGVTVNVSDNATWSIH